MVSMPCASSNRANPALLCSIWGCLDSHGLDVFKDLRGSRETRDIPVIVVTGTDTANLDRGDFACVLEKPITPDQLVEAVEKCLASWRGK